MLTLIELWVIVCPETRVACGNEYIRAKAKFDELYKQGKF